jgi:hypothetical protein
VRPRLLTVILVVVGVAAGAFAFGRATAPEHNSTATPHASVTTMSSVGDDQALRALRPFAGDWYWHGEGVTIERDGRGTAVWRTYGWCDDTPPPCDRSEGDLIISGGAAFFVLVRATGDSADGYVLTSSDPTSVAVGPLHIELRPGDHLSFPGLGNGPLCGGHAVADCGA